MSELNYHYGPTPEDSDPGHIWHYDCGGRVWSLKEGLSCEKCHEYSAYEESGE